MLRPFAERRLAASRPRARRASSRGLTLLEVLVSVTILALMATLIYGAFDGMSKSRTGLARINQRYQEGRGALSRMTRDLESAFVSLHVPFNPALVVRTTAFIGQDSSPTDRVDFAAFTHRRLGRDTHESDQCEIGYFGSRDPEHDKLDLVRREAKTIDMDPKKGGVTLVVAEDIQSLDIKYLDPLTDTWLDTWDTTQAAGQQGRLPLQVKITLVLSGGLGEQPIRLMTKVPIAMQAPLTFAGQQ